MIAEIETLKFPVGKLTLRDSLSPSEVQTFIGDIQTLPERLRLTVSNLSVADLKLRYRPGSWTIAQLVHHLCDSHINAYIRTKLALTESNPTIKPYDENAWAELNDGKDSDIQPSLELLQSLHSRWVNCFKSLKETDLTNTFFHPETKKTYSILHLIQMYHWHGEHHLGQIKTAIEKKFE